MSPVYCTTYEIFLLLVLNINPNLQEGRELPEEVPDAAGLPDAVHRHHLLLLRHLPQGAPEQEERPAAPDAEVSQILEVI